MAALRGLLGAAAVALAAADTLPSGAPAAKGTQKTGKRSKEQKHKARASAPATTPTADAMPTDPIIIEDPCEAFPETSCGETY
jgi:hypothetical protein